jgi:long-subunit acyl-CoA synthetase (AMP-forming)
VVIDGEAEDGSPTKTSWRPARPEEPARKPSEEDLCWLLYTSGTTGLPKGAMLSHRNLMAAVVNSMCAWDAGTDDVCLFTFPQFHVAGYVMPMYHLRTYPVVILKASTSRRCWRTSNDTASPARPWPPP